MEQFVFDYLERLESRNTDQSKKAVGAVSRESAKLGKEEHEHEWTYQYHWNDEYGFFDARRLRHQRKEKFETIRVKITRYVTDSQIQPKRKEKAKGRGRKEDATSVEVIIM